MTRDYWILTSTTGTRCPTTITRPCSQQVRLLIEFAKSNCQTKVQSSTPSRRPTRRRTGSSEFTRSRTSTTLVAIMQMRQRLTAGRRRRPQRREAPEFCALTRFERLGLSGLPSSLGGFTGFGRIEERKKENKEVIGPIPCLLDENAWLYIKMYDLAHSVRLWFEARCLFCCRLGLSKVLYSRLYFILPCFCFCFSSHSRLHLI